MITLFRQEIEALIDLPNMAKAVEEACKAASAGKVKLPPVGHIASLIFQQIVILNEQFRFASTETQHVPS